MREPNTESITPLDGDGDPLDEELKRSVVTSSCLQPLAKVSEEILGLWTKRAKHLNRDWDELIG